MSVVKRVPRMSPEEYRVKLGLKRLTEDGAEKPNPVPMEPPVGYKKQPSIFENMRALVQAELARKAAQEGFDTEEEDENFEIEEDREPLSRHTYTEMDEEYVRSAVELTNKEIEKRKKSAAEQPAPPARPAPQAPRKSPPVSDHRSDDSQDGAE